MVPPHRMRIHFEGMIIGGNAKNGNLLWMSGGLEEGAAAVAPAVAG